MHHNYKSWYLINAQGQTLGRIATHIAQILRGKNKTNYLPYLNNGSYVIVINAAKVNIKGNKAFKKFYYHHSGKPGSLKQRSFLNLREKFPDRIIRIAVKGMLPKGSLGRQVIKKLKIYGSSKHPHSAQKPEIIDI